MIKVGFRAFLWFYLQIEVKKNLQFEVIAKVVSRIETLFSGMHNEWPLFQFMKASL